MCFVYAFLIYIYINNNTFQLNKKNNSNAIYI